MKIALKTVYNTIYVKMFVLMEFSESFLSRRASRKPRLPQNNICEEMV